MHANARVLAAALLAALCGGGFGDPAVVPPAPAAIVPPAPVSHPWSTNSAAWIPQADAICSRTTPSNDPYIEWSGACRDGHLDGPGTFGMSTPARGTVTMSATFVRGIAQGLALIRYAGGSRFEGMMRDNRPNGPGAYISNVGTRTEGVYVDDVLSGRILITYIDGTRRDTVYRDGAYDGPVVWWFPDGERIEGTQRGRVYDGPLVMTFPDGARLACTYANGEPVGGAVYTGADGKRLTGKFVDAKADPARQMPRYPELAARLGEQGTVLLSFVVGKDGQLSDVRLRQSSGSERLDHAVFAAALTWHYQPATIGGHPIAVGDAIGFPFVLPPIGAAAPEK